jgi:transcriptional regulator with XRE-family HTH domain
MAKSYLAKLERGEVENPGLKTLDAIAHALNATLADLLAPSEVAGRDVEAGGESDVLDFEKLLASIPPELRQFLQEMEKGGERLPADIVRSLASIQFRGKRPKTVSDWRFVVYDALSRSI